MSGIAKRQPLEAEFWDLIRHAPDIEATAFFAQSDYAAAVFENLSEEYLTRIAEIFSRHHNNCVHRRIREISHWELKTFPAHEVEVGYMEEELKPSIRRHRHELVAVASDSDVLAHKHYKDRDLKTTVPYDVYLATWTKKMRPRLIDGNHRAIHQVRQQAAGFSPEIELKIFVPCL